MEKEVKRKKRRKKRNLLIPILCFVIGILVGILCTMIFGEIGVSENRNSNDNHTKDEVVGVTDDMLEEEPLIIGTPYVDLYYPAKWEEQIRTVHVDEEEYSVEFYAKVNDKKEVHIFDIVFNGTEGDSLGTIKVEGKDEVSLNVISYNFEPGEKWTEEESSEIYMMLEDINYIIGMLQKEKGFESAY